MIKDVTVKINLGNCYNRAKNNQGGRPGDIQGRHEENARKTTL